MCRIWQVVHGGFANLQERWVASGHRHLLHRLCLKALVTLATLDSPHVHHSVDTLVYTAHLSLTKRSGLLCDCLCDC
jgi:hypothetical protein